MQKSQQPGRNLNTDVYSSSGTNVSEVRRQNERSGLTYNQVKEMLVKGKQNQSY